MDEKKTIDREKSYRYDGDRDLRIEKIPTSATIENLTKDDIKSRIEKILSPFKIYRASCTPKTILAF